MDLERDLKAPAHGCIGSIDGDPRCSICWPRPQKPETPHWLAKVQTAELTTAPFPDDPPEWVIDYWRKWERFMD